MYIPVFTFYIGFNTWDIYLPHVSQKSLLDPIPGPAGTLGTLAALTLIILLGLLTAAH
jgi:hypothetical protein